MKIKKKHFFKQKLVKKNVIKKFLLDEKKPQKEDKNITHIHIQTYVVGFNHEPFCSPFSTQTYSNLNSHYYYYYDEKSLLF